MEEHRDRMDEKSRKIHQAQQRPLLSWQREQRSWPRVWQWATVTTADAGGQLR